MTKAVKPKPVKPKPVKRKPVKRKAVKPKALKPKSKARLNAAEVAVSAGASPAVLDRLWDVIDSRRTASPSLSHSARLLSRGTAKIAQKFGEEAVECLIEAVGGHPEALIAESADVLYHLLVMWVDAGVRPEQVWAELHRREGVSGLTEKASRTRAPSAPAGRRTTKIP